MCSRSIGPVTRLILKRKWTQFVLVFNEGMRQDHKDNLKHWDYSKEAKIIAKASRIIWQNIFNCVAHSFIGNFNPAEWALGLTDPEDFIFFEETTFVV